MVRSTARYGHGAEIEVPTEVVEQRKEVTQPIHVGGPQRFGKQLNKRRELHTILKRISPNK